MPWQIPKLFNVDAKFGPSRGVAPRHWAKISKASFRSFTESVLSNYLLRLVPRVLKNAERSGWLGDVMSTARRAASME
jgi:hypothetical protein